MLKKLTFSVVALSLPLGLALPPRVCAQIVPDSTLPQPSTVTVEDALQRIAGGTQAGGNLFHSFDRFNVRAGETTYFDNAPSIDNIITRVTGGSPSAIDGLIRANGAANLFLVNPSGIVFGLGARLDIGGSFFATTADSLLFADGAEFNAAEPNGAGTGALPLLTINVPIGLQLGSNPGAIVNRSTGEGLQVQPGRTLALFGGNLFLEGGNLSAPQGRIELSSVAASGTVGILPADDADLTDGGAIALSGGAIVNASGLGGGTIRVRGGRVSLTEGSRLVADTVGDFDGAGIDIRSANLQMSDRSFISASTFGSGTGGDISIRANTLDITGTEPGRRVGELVTATFDPFNLKDGIYALSLGMGAGGNVVITADRATVRNGGSILTTPLALGTGGNLTFDTDVAEFATGSLIVTGSAGIGDSGDLTLSADRLRILEGTIVSSSPLNAGRGGNLTVRTRELELQGTPAGAAIPNGFFTSTLGTGAGGNLSVTTDRLVVEGGSQISASSSGAGTAGNLMIVANEIDLNGIAADGRFLSGVYASTSLLTVPGERGTASGGDLTVTANRLVVRDGAQISTATGNAGSAGDVRIHVAESVTVSGLATGVDRMVESVSFGIIGDGIVPSAIEANTRESGAAGDVYLQTAQLTVNDGAEVGVRGTNAGAAGNLDIKAGEIFLDNAGSLSASTIAGTGGNINLQASTIQLRNGSRIMTDANTRDGGNIAIDTNTLVAFENSDITANALQGRGGRVTINARGIFGTQFREALTPKSDITATSELGAAFSGVVELNTPDVQSAVGVVELEAQAIDPATLVTVSCRDYQGSELILTGRGGLPPDPTQPLSSDRPWQDLRFLEELPSTNNSSPVPSLSEALSPTPKPLVEATGWRINDRGQVELIAEVSSPVRSPLPNCQDRSMQASGNGSEKLPE
ncbi:MAG TPA: S-layer family protein [Oscillatoriales cyanobacterium M59_W2019_021]|nr:S-layer family protein [Oscillatoriales cyanobacterium M59_W2019_021]